MTMCQYRRAAARSSLRRSRLPYCHLILSVVLVGICCPDGLAAIIPATWTGGGDGFSYIDGANWNINQVPLNVLPLDTGLDEFDVVIPPASFVVFPSPFLPPPPPPNFVNSFFVGPASIFVLSGGGTFTSNFASTVVAAELVVDQATFVIPRPLGAPVENLEVIDDGLVRILGGGRYEGGLVLDRSDFIVDGGGRVDFETNFPVLVGTFDSGPSSLRVINGGVIEDISSQLLVGSSDSVPSLALISGPGSSVTGSRQIQVGAGGNGSLRINNGGTLFTSGQSSPTGSSGLIGNQGAGTGFATVTGPGSQWTQDGGLSVGFSAFGRLTVSDGGYVQSLDGFIGRGSGASGDATVDDNATWEVTRSLYVGGDASSAGGPGDLIVNPGGTVDVNSTLKVWNASTVDLNGTMNATTIQLSGGTFNFIGGRLTVGTFEGDLVQQGGTLAPGNSPGITAITSDYTLNAGSFEVELAGDGGVPGTDFDQLDVTGTATINAGATLDVTLFGGFTPSTGDVFPILVAGDINGTFDNENLPAGYAWNVDYNATTLTLEVLALLGDMNGDDNLTSADVPLFVQALVDRATYDSTYSFVNTDAAGDIDGSNTFDLGDLAFFSALFGGPASANAVPEPSAFLLALLAVALASYGSRRRRTAT